MEATLQPLLLGELHAKKAWPTSGAMNLAATVFPPTGAEFDSSDQLTAFSLHRQSRVNDR